jgi:predicted PurR-regulated permease PerM
VRDPRSTGRRREGAHRAPTGVRPAVVGALVLVGGLVVVQLAWLLLRPLTLLLLAIVLAQAVEPAAHWLSRWLPWAVAVVVTYVVGVLVVASVGWLVVPRLIADVGDLAQTVPQLVDQLRQSPLGRYLPGTTAELVNELRPQIVGGAVTLTGLVAALPVLLFSSLADLVSVSVMSIYWLIAAPATLRFVLSLFPDGQQERVHHLLSAAGAPMGGYVRATLLLATTIGVLSYAGLLVIGVRYPVVLATLAFVAEFIPFLGPLIGGVPAVLVALSTSLTQAVVVVLFYLVLHQLENHVLAPNVVRSQANIPPILVIFALVAGFALLGVVGAVAAVPLGGALQVLVVEGLAPAARRRTGAAPPVITSADVPGSRSRRRAGFGQARHRGS